MLADHDTFDVARGRDMGGLSALMYFLTVSLCMPDSRIEIGSRGGTRL